MFLFPILIKCLTKNSFTTSISNERHAVWNCCFFFARFIFSMCLNRAIKRLIIYCKLSHIPNHNNHNKIANQMKRRQKVGTLQRLHHDNEVIICLCDELFRFEVACSSAVMHFSLIFLFQYIRQSSIALNGRLQRSHSTTLQNHIQKSDAPNWYRYYYFFRILQIRTTYKIKWNLQKETNHKNNFNWTFHWVLFHDATRKKID